MTIPKSGLSTEVKAFHKLCLMLGRSVHTLHAFLQELKSSSFWPVVETAIQVATIMHICWKHGEGRRPSQGGQRPHPISSWDTTFQRWKKLWDSPFNTDFVVGRDRARKPESNLKRGHNQEMDSPNQVMILSTIKSKCHNSEEKDKIVLRTLHYIVYCT